jgi:hypothetical protein
MEEFLYGQSCEQDLEHARQGLQADGYFLAKPRTSSQRARESVDHAALAVSNALAPESASVNECLHNIVGARLWETDERGNWTVKAELSSLLRDVCGNPFRSALVDSAWLRSRPGTVLKIAAAINEDRAFDRLPILADALEDAGCDNADILAHCRGPGPHVRGCWVVDLILRKT